MSIDIHVNTNMVVNFMQNVFHSHNKICHKDNGINVVRNTLFLV